LLAIPAVSQAANRNEILKLGPANYTVPIFENLMDSRSTFLTANTTTAYSWMWLDLRNGPLVLEAPPKVLGALNDMWYRWVVDIGFTGPDKGQGGKYLVLPPGYKGNLHCSHSATRVSSDSLRRASADQSTPVTRRWWSWCNNRPIGACGGFLSKRPVYSRHRPTAAGTRKFSKAAAHSFVALIDI
jgi:hypothetical protein